jgi:orotate phosphoribosyltransferase
VVYQPVPGAASFGKLPLYYLAKLEASYFAGVDQCELCAKGAALEKVRI